MSHTREQVMSAVQAAFPGKVAAVIKELDRYGVESWEREKERVQLAIVKLSGSDESKLPYLIETAKRDYRDVLCWLETGPLSEAEGQAARAAVKRILEQWGPKPDTDG